MSTKVCSRCKEIKSLICFGLDKSRKDGHGIYCKSCSKIKANLYEMVIFTSPPKTQTAN